MSKIPNSLRKPRFFYGWWIVFTVILAGIVQSSQGHPALGAFMKPMTEYFGWSRGGYASGMTIGSMLGGFIAVFIGPLVDRHGGRWILTGSSLIVGGTVILTGFVKSFWQFFVLQIIARTVNMGIVVLVMQVVIPKWFIRKRGRAVAFGHMGGMMGNAGTPLFIQFIVSRFGWRAAAVTLGVSVWTLCVPPIWFFLRRRPEDMGLLPDGDKQNPEQTGENSSGKNPTSSRIETSMTVREVLRHRSLYLLITAFTLSSLVGSSLNLHAIPYLSDRGLTAGLAVSVMAVLSSTGGIGAIIMGFIVERYPARFVLSIAFLLVSFSYIILLNVNGPGIAFLWAGYAGMVRGGGGILGQIIYADYYGRDSLGSIRGLTSPAQMGANAVGPLLAALAFDFRGDYSFIFALYGFLMIAASFSVFLARPPTNSITAQKQKK
jgi:MFS family permease